MSRRLTFFLRRSVRGRLALMVLAVVLPAMLLGTVLVWQAYQNEKAAVGRQLATSARALSELVDRELEQSVTLLKGLSTSTALEEDDYAGVYERAKRLVPETDRWVVLVTAERQQVVNTLVPFGTPLPQSEIDPDFEAAMRKGETYISNVIVGALSKGQVVHVALPVLRNGRWAYSLHLAMNPAALARILHVERFAPNSIVSVLDRHGTIAARSRGGDKFVGKKAMPDVVQAALARTESVGESTTLEGIPVIRAVSSSPTSGWSIVIGAPKLELYASAQHLLLIGFILTVLLISVAVGMALWIGSTLARSVENLARDAERIGQGAFPKPNAADLVETDSVAAALHRTASRLDMALSTARLAVWGWDATEDRVTLSEKAIEILGCAPATSSEWSTLRPHLVTPAGPAGLGPDYFKSAERSEEEYKIPHATGPRWVLVRSRPLLDANGAVLGRMGVVQDITAQRTAEARLRSQQTQLSLISTNAPVMLAHCGSDQRYLFVNQAYAVRMGRASSDFIGRTVAEMLGPEQHALLTPSIAKVLSGRTVEFESHGRTSQGEDRVLYTTLVPDIAEDGQVRGWLSATTDVTDRHRAEEARRHLAAIVEFSDDAIISKDLDGRIMTWNPAASRMYGYTAEEVIGRSILILIPPDRHMEEAELLSRLRRNERIEHFETVRMRRSGELIDVSLSVSPIRNSEGRIVGASKIARDITAQKRAAQQQEALYQLVARVNRADQLPEILQAAVDALCRCQQASRASVAVRDIEGVMRIRLSRALPDLLRDLLERNLPLSERASVSAPTLIDDVSKSSLGSELKLAFENAGIHALAILPLRYENEGLGQCTVYFDQVHPFGNEDLRVAEAIASQVSFAIVRQNQSDALEALVDERTASLRQAVAQMHEFSYSVSHDLRAPVRAMRGYAEAVLEDYGLRLDSEGRELLTRILRNSTRMERLIQDLLTYSRLTQELTMTPIALDRLVEEVVQQYPSMQPEKADIIVAGRLPIVVAHEPSLTQVISNLLSNAVKFVAPGVRPRVIVRAERRGDRARIWFEDNGIGIAARHQQRLFGMFERLHPEKQYEGTGIGLAIVRKAMERMEGAVGVESDGATGSRFWIELTLSPSEREKLPDLASSTAGSR